MPEILVERELTDNEEDRLLSDDDWMEMADFDRDTTIDTGVKNQQLQVEGRYTDGEPLTELSGSRSIGEGDEVALANANGDQLPVEYRVYKIRWFGLTQLILLNIVVSWDVCLL